MRKKATRFLLACMLISFSMTVFAQERKIVTGVLQDNKGVPVSGASVVEKGTPNGTSSDANGNFSLSVLTNATLVLSAVGYETQ